MTQTDEQIITVVPTESDSSAVADSLVATDPPREGILISHPAPGVPLDPRPSPPGSASWIILALLVLFVTVCLRFRNNFKYFNTLVSSLTDVRERANAFDDTVRESVFMILLNILGGITTGLLLYSIISLHTSIPPTKVPTSMGVCIIIMLIYGAVMPLLYRITGAVFTDRRHTSMLLQGYGAATSLLGIVLLPPVLVAIFYPSGAVWAVPVAVILFVLVKLTFVFKALRIFITHFSSWVVFLYYLCSLEIVPLVLIYVIASEIAV